MWLLNQLDSVSAVYNIPIVLRLSGPVDVDALHAAIVDVVTRHEALRTTFPAEGGVPHQKILRPSAVAARLDWSVVDSESDMADAVLRGFDVTKQLPIRVRIWESAPEEFVLAVVAHHIAFDGESMSPFVTDLVTAYFAEADEQDPEFAELPVQFADYAIWQHEVLGAPDRSETVLGRQLAYWRARLSGVPDLVELPSDRPRPVVATHRGALVRFQIPEALGEGIDSLAASTGTTPFMVVHAALASLVARMSAQEDIAIGTPIAGRGQEVLDGLIGMFVNTLVLRTDVDGGMPFAELLATVKTVDLEAYANADIPFESVVEATGQTSSASYSPFTQVWLTFDQSAVPELAGQVLAGGDVAGITVSAESQEHMPAKVDLLVGVSRAADGPWSGAMVYATDLFDESTVLGFSAHLLAILEQAIADSSTPIGDIVLPTVPVAVPAAQPAGKTPAARVIPDSDAILASGAGADPVLLPEMLAAAAKKWGPRQAVIDSDGAFLTYAQLDARSNQLARWLIDRGVGPESLVALAIGRSLDLLIAIWAVAKTGGGYVPIDPTYPAGRVSDMVEDSAAVLGLGVAGSGDLPEHGFDWLRLDGDVVAAEIAAYGDDSIDSQEVLAPIRIENTAYVIYTSGSTGRPKGVSVTHAGLANFAAEEVRRSGADEYSRVLGFASPSFDASVLEYMLAAASGGVLIFRPDGAVGGEPLQTFIVQHAITHTFLTPTVLATLEPSALPALRVVYVGGEAVPQPLKDAWAPFRRIQNLYGPTETTIGVAISEPMQIGDPVLLGGPIAGVGFCVLDGRLKPVPIGVAGELYLCGDALSRGYLARPGLTATRFVANPYGIPGDRLYRTGDLVRWRRGDGGEPTVEYVGRGDDQVKLRGLRIELGEIESVLADHPGVTGAVVIGVGGSEISALAGYVVCKGDPVDMAELRQFIAERLPSHMVPASLMSIDRLPMTPVGKLDKSALPEPVIVAGEYVEPATDEERVVADAFAEVLGVEQVSVTDSFFDLGGTSLSAMRVVGRVAQSLNAEVTIQDVFTAPSVRELVVAASGRSRALPPIVAQTPRPELIPLSFAQQRMWFINRFDPGTSNYNIPFALSLTGVLDVGALRSALVDVVSRHEVLRTTYPAIDGVPHQLVHPATSVPDRLDWRSVDDEAELERELLAGFDVTSDQPVRVRILELGQDEWVLALVAHHIAVDGESLEPLAEDLLVAYAARAADAGPELEPLDIQFADFAIWQHDVLGAPDDAESVMGTQLAYWREHLAGLPDVITLPTDHPRPPVASGAGASVSTQISPEVSDRIRQVAADNDATPFIILHAALVTLLARLSASDDIAVTTPFAGRGQAALERLIGMFVNTLVLRARVDNGESFVQLIEQLKEVDFAGFGHADVPFETIVEELNPVRSEAFAPLAQVMLSVDPAASARRRRIDFGELAGEFLDSDRVVAQRDLTFVVTTAEAGESWQIRLEYATDLFQEASAERLIQWFVALLAGLTAEPSRSIGDIGMPGQDSAQATEQGPQVDLPPVVSIGEAVADQIVRTPDAVALISGERAVTYGEFGARVNVLARKLLSMGLEAESAVAIAMPRSVEMLIAVHAIVTAGGQYVPIDLETPSDRAEYMLVTSGARMLLVADRDAAGSALGAAEDAAIEIVEVDASGWIDASSSHAKPLTDADRRGPVHSASAVYTLFTSGSTGMPKGVTLSHEAVLNRLWWGLDELPIGSSDVVLQKTPYTFDCSVPELFAPLMAGAAMVVLRDGGHLEPTHVADEIARTGVTMVHFVPSMLSVFVDVVPLETLQRLDSVRIISTTGEALPPAVASQTREVWPEALFYNLYGPTEAAVEITYQSIGEVTADDPTVPIGTPIWHSSALVLDSRLHRVPPGVPGELYLGGVQLARGYAARADLTAERFIADPFGAPGARLYRTGDLVRRLPDGGLDYLGRTDFQVKLRGQRIELGEIEAVLAGAPGVVHTAVTVAQSPDGGEHLVAYLAAGPGETLDLSAVTESATNALPRYMVPTVWMLVDDIALNTAGKIDRKALPEPEFGVLEVEWSAPDGEAEEKVAAIFAEILDVENVSATQSFFDVGGNSLSAMRVVARVGDSLGVDLTVRDLFEAPTIRELASVSTHRAPALAPVTRVVPRPDRVPLSFAQQRMWFINRLHPTLPTYNIPAAFRLRGTVDEGLLLAALRDVLARHEVLRTVFPADDGVPFQSVAATDELGSLLDWRVVDSVSELATDLGLGFDVTAELPVRGRVLRDGEDSLIVGLVAHHIAFDGQSFGPMIADFLAAYAARTRGTAPQYEPLPVQYADYSIWQHEVLGSPQDDSSVMGKQLAFWKRELAGVPDVIGLPTDHPRPRVFSHQGDVVHFTIPADLGAQIDAFAARQGTTRFMVLHAVFAVTLARLSDTQDIVVGTPIDNRGRNGLDAMVGMFVNTLVLRSWVDPAEPFAAFAARSRAADLDAFAHADVPFESIVDAIDPVRSEAFSPLVQVIFSVDPMSTPTDASIDDLKVEAVDPPDVPAQLDLNLTISTGDGSGGWSGHLTYATALYDRSSIEWFSSFFVRTATALLGSPGIPVGDLALATDAERARVLKRSVGPVATVPETTIAEAVAAQVEARPTAVALIAGQREIGYAEFGARVGELARVLIASGVGPEVAVGLVMDRSIEMVVAVHAVLAAGGQYVPIGMDYPAERAQFVASAGDVRIVVTRAGAEPPTFVHELQIPVIEADCSAQLPPNAKPLNASERPAALVSANAAYTLFTSGSTGKPKGVTVSHGAVHNFVTWLDEEVPSGAHRLLFKTPYTFDASVLELFWPLAAGHTMVIADAQGHRDPKYLSDLIASSGVTVVQFVPSLLAAFLDVVDDVALLPGLRALFSGGEALPPAVAREFRSRVPQARIMNLFGPTEAAVYTTAADLADIGDVVPIGTPMLNTSAFILDTRLHPVPDGVVGELYLGGVQAARGYAARVDLTAERFVADPFGAPGSRLYRTGDLVRRSRSGSIHYLGRADFQVKLRGQRLELGEVEALIAAAPGVVHAVVRVVSGPAGDQLVGYVAPKSVNTDSVAAELDARLPGFMVPTSWVALDEMPLNSAGKVDRRALPDPVFEAGDHSVATSEAEVVVAGVFAELLGVERVSVTASFFELGGNSLSAMRLVSRVSEVLGVELSVRDVFDAPSVRGLVGVSVGRGVGLPPVVAVVPRPVRVPLSFAQARMWFINQLDPSLPTYNIPAVLRLTGRLDVAALRAAFVDVVVRHEVLRTVFPAVDGVPFQEIASVDEVDGRLDWAVVGSRAELEAAVSAGFDVTSDWPLRVRLWRVGEGEFVLAVVAHHIAADGESMRPLVADVVGAYAVRAAGGVPVVAPLSVQFADFAVWQHEVLGSPADGESVVGGQLGYWREQLVGAPEVLALPADRPRPRVASHRGAKVDVVVPVELGDRVLGVARSVGVTPFMVVHAGLAVLLGRLAATGDVCVATPIAGRGQAVLEPLVGMFVNTLVLRTRVDASMSFVEVLEGVRRTDLDAFAHADAPFEAVVEAVDPVRSEAFSPLAQVMLAVVEGREVDPGVEVGDLRVEPVEASWVPAQYDLTVNLSIDAGRDWPLSLVFATDLFDVSTVEGFAERFVGVLDQLTADPSVAVGDVGVLLRRDRELLAALPLPVVSARGRGSLVEMFADSVAAHADAVAVSAGGASLTYVELDRRSDAVAAGLVAAGVCAGDLVGVALARSVDLVAAIVGVLKVGAGYLPLDVTNPVDRLAYIVRDAGVGVALADSSTVGHELWSVVDGEVEVLDVDVVGQWQSGGFVGGVVPVSARAYVIYTSGSTGRPKGVEVTHAEVGALLSSAAGDFEFRSDDVWTMFHSYAFDFSVWELWGPLLSGARLVVVDRDLARDMDGFVSLLESEGVTFLNLTPSAFYQLIDARRRRPEVGLGLRYVVFGGEELAFEQVRRWFEDNPGDGAQLVNMYGITETTVHVSFRPIERSDVADAAGVERSLIGRPLSSLAIHVLDDRLQPVPEGVVGEMYVAGAQLAQGYLGQPGLTASRFVADRFGGRGERLYRTGDLARRVGDDIEYLGRADGQVQLRGFRIEYGEVEEALVGVSGVVAAAVRVVGDLDRGDLLIGYVVAEAGVEIDPQQVREQAGVQVPRYMVPDLVMVVDQLPLTANGKLDRAALPAPVFVAAEFVEPDSEAERVVAAVFAGVLGVDRVSVTESFFDAGGNSLSAMRLVARVGEALDVEVSVRDVFDAPSVRDLAAAVIGRARALPPITAVDPRPDRIPLSFAQQRMWFINQFDPELATYNIPVALRLVGDLDVSKLREAVADVIGRHEVLRTTYPTFEGVPVQSIDRTEAITENFASGGVWEVVATEAELMASAVKGFDVTEQWPLRVRLLPVSTGEHLLVVTVHHIAADGESLAPLLADMVTAYSARIAGTSPQFLPLAVQVADVAIWQSDVLGSVEDPDSVIGRQLDYWRARLSGAPDLLELPTDRPRPARPSHRGVSVSFPVPAAIVDQIRSVAQQHGATPFIVLHAAFAVLLGRLSATDDIVIGSPIAGRGQEALDRLVGMFANTLTLRTRIEVNESFSELLDRVRDEDLSAFEHSDIPFEALVEAVDPVRSEAFS
ncbi:amino acid adenylation domain-containing protein, partial [Gordonia caeni]|uniref:amino acid adenylation domain-containing protein n=1 Tax=Gordonia caeni TaxID=1007097 RepID=UPI0031D2CE15